MTGRDWTRFLALRFAAALAVLIVLSFGVFALLYLSPGSVERTLLGTRPASPESIAAIRAQYNLDDPFILQYVQWLGSALTGDLGTSIRTGEPVTSAVFGRVPLTGTLITYAVVLAIFFGLLLGIVAAIRRGSAADQLVSGVAVAGVSAPPFATGLLLLIVFAVGLGWFPVYGAGDGGLDTLYHLTLPAAALALSGAGLVLRFTRTSLSRELGRDYVVFARGRGLTRRQTQRYAMRNAWLPVITAVALVVTSTVVATVMVEVTFSLPGLGKLLVDAITFKDVPVVQAITLGLTLVITVTNLLADVAYALVDPRTARGSTSR